MWSGYIFTARFMSDTNIAIVSPISMSECRWKQRKCYYHLQINFYVTLIWPFTIKKATSEQTHTAINLFQRCTSDKNWYPALLILDRHSYKKWVLMHGGSQSRYTSFVTMESRYVAVYCYNTIMLTCVIFLIFFRNISNSGSDTGLSSVTQYVAIRFIKHTMIVFMLTLIWSSSK